MKPDRLTLGIPEIGVETVIAESGACAVDLARDLECTFPRGWGAVTACVSW